MTGVDKDLATLRSWDAPWVDRRNATARVEAELSRLREQRAAAQRQEARAWERAKAAEAECARLQTIIAQQLTPLDVAITHIAIIRHKCDDYTADERENVAAIVEHHAREARTALFEALAGPDTPADDWHALSPLDGEDTPADSQEDTT